MSPRALVAPWFKQTGAPMMKRSLVAGVVLTCVLAGSALAADFPTKVHRPSPEFFCWSGFYIGAHLGYGLSSNDWKVDDGTGTTFNIGAGAINGAIGGAQAGINWQTGPVVLGVEADFSLGTCRVRRATLRSLVRSSAHPRSSASAPSRAASEAHSTAPCSI